MRDRCVVSFTLDPVITKWIKDCAESKDMSYSRFAEQSLRKIFNMDQKNKKTKEFEIT